MLRNLLLTLSLCCVANAWAGGTDPIISKAWVGETIPGQSTATLQLNLTTVKAAQLISVSSPAAESIEIQRVTLYKGAMTPRTIESLKLPGRNTIAFGSHGLFLMLTGLKQPLKAGDRIPLNMVFTVDGKQKKNIAAEAEVRQMELSYKHYGPKEVYDHR